MTQHLPTHDKRDREEPGLNWARITAISFAIALHIAALMLLLVPVTPPGAERRLHRRRRRPSRRKKSNSPRRKPRVR
jgi:hypothetical protein